MKTKNILLLFGIFMFVFQIKCFASDEYTLSKENINLFRGQSFTLEAIFDYEEFDENSEDYIEEWTLESELPLTYGEVTIHKNIWNPNKCSVSISSVRYYSGNCKITAISKSGISKSCNVFVPTFEELFGIDTSFKYLNIGSTIDLTPKYELASELSIVSSDENVIKMDENNLLTVVGVGSASISISNIPNYVWFYTSDLKEFDIDKTSLIMNVSETATLNIKLEGDGTFAPYWSSSNQEVVQIISGGEGLINDNKTINIVGLKKGKATITVTLKNGEKRTCDIEVVIPSKSIKLNKESLNLNIGDTYKLNAQILPEDASYTDIEWKSSDNDIATVDSAGNVQAINSGIVKVIAKTKDGIENDCIILVFGKQLQITTIPYTSMMKFNSKTSINSIVNVNNFPVLENDYIVEVYNISGNLKDKMDNIGSKDQIQVKDKNGEVVSEFTTVVPGDVTGNGYVRMYDSFEILKGAVTENKGLDEIDYLIRDYNQDGNIRMYDAFQYLREAVSGK